MSISRFTENYYHEIEMVDINKKPASPASITDDTGFLANHLLRKTFIQLNLLPDASLNCNLLKFCIPEGNGIKVFDYKLAGTSTRLFLISGTPMPPVRGTSICSFIICRLLCRYRLYNLLHPSATRPPSASAIRRSDTMVRIMAVLCFLRFYPYA